MASGVSPVGDGASVGTLVGALDSAGPPGNRGTKTDAEVVADGVSETSATASVGADGKVALGVGTAGGVAQAARHSRARASRSCRGMVASIA